MSAAESCISGISTPLDSYIGDSCGSFEFLNKESQLRRLRKSVDKESSSSPPRDIKREIQKRAVNLHVVKNEGESSKVELKLGEDQGSHQSQGTAESAKSGASRKSSGSDRRSSGSDQRRRRRSSQGSSGSNHNNDSCLSKKSSKKLANLEEVR